MHKDTKQVIRIQFVGDGERYEEFEMLDVVDEADFYKQLHDDERVEIEHLQDRQRVRSYVNGRWVTLVQFIYPPS